MLASLQTFGQDQIEQRGHSVALGVMRERERGLSVVMCGVSTSFLTRPIPPSGGGGTGEKEVWARRSSGRFISRGPSNPGHPTPSTGFRREDMPAFAAAAASSQNGGKMSKSWGVGWLNPCQPPLAIMPRLIFPENSLLGADST